MINEKAEMRLGDESKREIIKEYGRYLNPQVQAYINEVGQRIVNICERKNIKYDFVVLDTPLVNAFAVPGTVFITRGILELIDDEAELASVIGHEVGHITGFHAVKLMQKTYGYSFLATFAAVAGVLYAPQFKSGQEAQAYYETLFRGVGLVTAGFLNGYGRDFELEADRSGLRYSILAGYDPDAMVSFFKRMQTLGEDNLSGLAVFLRTHPPTDERIKQSRKIIALALDEEPAKKREKIYSVAKIKEIAAILKSTASVYQDNFARYQEIVRTIPKKEFDNPGTIQGQVYENPAVGVRLEAPRGWKLEYSYGSSLLTLYSPDGKAQGELITQPVQSDPVLSAEKDKNFAGTFASTEVVSVKDWSEAVEQGLKLEKRTGRVVDYPAGTAYVGTYMGHDRVGRPAFYKVLYVLKGDSLESQRGFLLTCACPDESYMDYMVDFEKIMENLNWIGAKNRVTTDRGQGTGDRGQGKEKTTVKGKDR